MTASIISSHPSLLSGRIPRPSRLWHQFGSCPNTTYSGFTKEISNGRISSVSYTRGPQTWSIWPYQSWIIPITQQCFRFRSRRSRSTWEVACEGRTRAWYHNWSVSFIWRTYHRQTRKVSKKTNSEVANNATSDLHLHTRTSSYCWRWRTFVTLSSVE